MSSTTAAMVKPIEDNGLVRALIMTQGVVTVLMAFAFLPLGVAGMLVNAALAFGSHGENRRLFAGFAIAAAVACACVGLFLLPAGASSSSTSAPVG
ncbi:hypothetical protein ACIPJU_12840 [Micrococcus endophyticus]|uniref:hypothetical protein n=1 Tax=Micrococcus TaxID=1269 RepID=UPI0037F21B3A